MKRVPAVLLLLGLVACAPGDPIGQVDAMKPSSLDVDLAAGDKLRFRVDIEAELIGPENQGLRRTDAVVFFERSQLVVTVKEANGGGTVRCPLKGNGTTQGKSGSKIYEKGLIVSCEFPVAQAGKHQVSATIAIDPGIKALSATVEVRKVAKK